MTSADIGSWIAVVSTVVSAVYAALGYHRSRGKAASTANLGASARFPILLVGILTIISCCAVGFDYYDRHAGGGGVQVGIGAEIRGLVTVTDDKGKDNLFGPRRARLERADAPSLAAILLKQNIQVNAGELHARTEANPWT